MVGVIPVDCARDASRKSQRKACARKTTSHKKKQKSSPVGGSTSKPLGVIIGLKVGGYNLSWRPNETRPASGVRVDNKAPNISWGVGALLVADAAKQWFKRTVNKTPASYVGLFLKEKVVKAKKQKQKKKKKRWGKREWPLTGQLVIFWTWIYRQDQDLRI